jgi:hypothetical protein
VVKITISWSGQFKGSEANIVQGFIINDHAFISIFNQLMDGQGGIVGFDNCIRYFRGRDDGKGLHNSVRIFFSNFGDQKGTHTRSSTTTQGVGDLETLEAIASFSFFSDDIEYGVDEFGTFSVVTFSPVVSCSSLSENKVVRSEELTEWSSSNGVHGSWHKIHEYSSWNITTTGCFVVIKVYSF